MPPRCVGCGRPVLELHGQYVQLGAYLLPDDAPDLAGGTGSWHARCLAGTDLGPRWRVLLVRSYLAVRGYDLVQQSPHWTVVRNPRTGETLALLADGATLELPARAVPGPPVPGGASYLVDEPMYVLEWDPPVPEEIQRGLRATGTVALAAVADRLGIWPAVSHPDLFATAALHLDEELVPDWSPRYVLAAARYPVFVPEALVGYLSRLS